MNAFLPVVAWLTPKSVCVCVCAALVLLPSLPPAGRPERRALEAYGAAGKARHAVRRLLVLFRERAGRDGLQRAPHREVCASPQPQHCGRPRTGPCQGFC